MNDKFKPILAAAVDKETFHKINFPVLVSPKLDGIRVLIRNTQAVTRSLKPVRNKQVQRILGTLELEGLDGEIIVGPPTDPHAFRATTSGVMAEEGESDFVYYVFDDFHREPDCDYQDFMYRYYDLTVRIIALNHPRVKLVEHRIVTTIEELLTWEQKYLDEGFEGIMLRSLNGIYKHGRSTLNQGTLLKLKRFADAEATIIGFVERMKNMNEQTRDKLGHAERSSHKENMIPEGTLGAFRVKSEVFKEVFTVGSGLNDEERQEIWDNCDKYLGQTLKFKYFDYGDYDQPRFPIYLGIRAQEDIL